MEGVAVNRNFNINLPSLLIGAVFGIGVLLLILRPWEGVPDSIQDQLNLIQVQRDSLMAENLLLKQKESEIENRIASRDSVILVYKSRLYEGKNYLRSANRTQLVGFFSNLDTNGVFSRR